MNATVVRTGEVCADCLIVIANGDTSGIPDAALPDWLAGVQVMDATEHGTLTIVPTDDEPRFAYRRGCDYCGTMMGRDRYPVAFIR